MPSIEIQNGQTILKRRGYTQPKYLIKNLQNNKAGIKIGYIYFPKETLGKKANIHITIE